MSKQFSRILFSLLLLSQTISFSEEGDIEHLVVPEVQNESFDTTEAESSGGEDTVEAEPKIIENQPEAVIAENTEQTDAQSASGTSTEEAPSEDELEAKRAEEAELREVGAGEEPTIE